MFSTYTEFNQNVDVTRAVEDDDHTALLRQLYYARQSVRTAVVLWQFLYSI